MEINRASKLKEIKNCNLNTNGYVLNFLPKNAKVKY